MTPYARLLLSRPRPARVPRDAIASLLSDAGVAPPERGAESALPRLAAEIGVEPELLQGWIQGTAAASFRDLCSLALALDLHPEFARQGPVRPSRVRPSGSSRERTQIAAVPPAASTARPSPARPSAPAPHAVAEAARKAPAPLVEPEPEPASADGGKAQPPQGASSGGVEVTIASGGTEGYDPADYRSWLAAWLAERFAPPISVALGNRPHVRGLPPETVSEAFAEYRETTRKEVWRSGHALLNAVADWGNQPEERERHASLARVAALRILQVAETHRDRLRLDLPEESALRTLAESSPDTWHRAITEHSSKLFRCGRRIMDAWNRSGSGARSA